MIYTRPRGRAVASQRNYVHLCVFGSRVQHLDDQRVDDDDKIELSIRGSELLLKFNIFLKVDDVSSTIVGPCVAHAWYEFIVRSNVFRKSCFVSRLEILAYQLYTIHGDLTGCPGIPFFDYFFFWA